MNNDHLNKKINSFYKRFFFYTEAIAHLLILPFSAFVFISALNIEGWLTDIKFYIIALIIIIFSLIISFCTAKIIVRPLSLYFNRVTGNESISDADRNSAFSRYEDLPKLHCIILIVKWTIMMGSMIAIIYLFFRPSITDKINIWTTSLSAMIIGGLLFYTIPGVLLGSLAAYGLFNKDAGQHKIKGSLSRNLSANFVCIIVIVVIIMIVVAYNMMNGRFRENELNISKNSANIILIKIENYLNNIKVAASDLARNRSIIDFLATGKIGNAGAVLKNIEKAYNWCDYSIIAVAKEDSLILASSRDNAAGSFSSDGLYKSNITEAIYSKLWISSLHKSPFTGNDIIMVTAPVITDEKVIGIAGLAVNANTLSVDIFKNEATLLKGEIYITDPDLNIIASINSQIKEANLAKMSWSSELKGLKTGTEFRYYDNEAWKYMTGLSSRKMPVIVSVSISLSEIERNAWSITLPMILSSLIGLIVIAFLTYLMIKKKLKPLVKTNKLIAGISDGDISQQVYVTGNDEISQILKSIIILSEKLNGAIIKIKSVSETLKLSAHEMKNTTDNFSASAQQQAASTEELSASVEEISAGVENISDGVVTQNSYYASLEKILDTLSKSINTLNLKVSESTKAASQIEQKAKEGEDSLRIIGDTMNKITESFNKMNEVIGIIDDISERINLLSLNAAIEAARAGESGRGFAVVADEISKLADQTSSSIGDISNLIKVNDSEITKGIESTNSSVNLINSIIKSISVIVHMTTEISGSITEQLKTNKEMTDKSNIVREKNEEIKSAATEQNKAIGEIVKSISLINETTQSHAAGSEEMTANANSLNEMANSLIDAVEYFRVRKT